MNLVKKKITVLLFLVALLSFNAISQSNIEKIKANNTITPAANLPNTYLPYLKGKKIALVTNQTGMYNEMHLVDFLLENEITISKIFAPEHGFRGDASDGTEIKNGKDTQTGIQVISIYGKKKKPSKEDLKDVDIIVFDIQDVGVRFYTYISSLSYVMEAAAENNIQIIVLDRPNPNSHYIDGPILEKEYSSFVGLHEVPVVYGMTIGEYALMVKGERWISQSEKLDLKIIPVKNYTHDSIYSLPVAPSPNLPNNESIYLYPWICYFEGANVSIGRGTDAPFQLIGFPNFSKGDTIFTPRSIPGKSEHPPYLNKQCKGINLKKITLNELTEANAIDWTYVWEMYSELGEKEFFIDNNYFDLLAGSKLLRKALVEGWSIDRFKKEYQPKVDEFKKTREKYLIYD